MHYLETLAAQKESQPTFQGFDDVNNMEGYDVMDDCDAFDLEDQFDDFDFEMSNLIHDIDALPKEL